MKKRYWGLLAGLFLCSVVWAQDMNFSQFHNAPFMLNPGLTGVFNGNVRTLAMYRNQWRQIPVGYNTFAAGYDMRHYQKRCSRKYFFSHGLILHYDQAGDAQYYHTSLQLLGSYTQRLGSKFYGTLGVKMGPAIEGFNQERLTTNNQFDPLTGRPDLGRSIGEENNLRTDNLAVFDMSAGINIRYQKLDNASAIDFNNQRTRVDFGIGLFHLTNPRQAFSGERSGHNLNFRVNPYVIYVQQLGRKELLNQGLGWDILVAWRTQFQQPSLENNVTLGAKVYLQSFQPGSTALMITATARIQDQMESFIPGIELFIRDFQFGFSYDVTTSDLQNAARGDGGFMVSFSYIFRKVNIPCRRACPII